MKFFSDQADFFSDVSGEVGNFCEKVKVFHLNMWEKVKNENGVFVHEGLPPKEVVATTHQKQISHLVQKNKEGFCQDLKLAGLLVEHPDQYFTQGPLIVTAGQLQSCQIFFDSAADKEKTFDRAIGFLDALQSEITNQAAVVVLEELFMNATIDAPKEAQRKGLQPNKKQCEFYLCHDENTLQISCSDPYGSLDLKKLLARMDEVYRKGAGEAINFDGAGGAGIGCYLLFEQCKTLIIGVRPGLQTKVSCLIPLKMSRRRKSEISKSLHSFES